MLALADSMKHDAVTCSAEEHTASFQTLCGS
jgi:hypothetical protein